MSPNFEHQGLARSWPPSIVRSSTTRCDGLDPGDSTHSPDSRRGVFQWRLAAAKNAAGTTFFWGVWRVTNMAYPMRHFKGEKKTKSHFRYS